MTELHTDLSSLPAAAQNAVVVIGNFDGLHLGHQTLLANARNTAEQIGAPLLVLTFEPHPREYFQPSAPPFRIMLLPAKQRLLATRGVDHLVALSFDAEFATQTAQAFIDDILVKALNARHVVVGEDFAFGSKRQGNAQTLKAAEATGKFGLTLFPLASCANGEHVSSSRIRGLLKEADFDKAEELLGHPWYMEAPVIHGDKRGRTLGYPTANQSVPRYTLIPHGVYAVLVQIEDETKWHAAVSNYGIRPMFLSEKPLLETFIFDFNNDIYTKNLRVRPLRLLRPEMKFANVEELIMRIEQDCQDARRIQSSCHRKGE